MNKEQLKRDFSLARIKYLKDILKIHKKYKIYNYMWDDSYKEMLEQIREVLK